ADPRRVRRHVGGHRGRRGAGQDVRGRPRRHHPQGGREHRHLALSRRHLLPVRDSPADRGGEGEADVPAHRAGRRLRVHRKRRRGRGEVPADHADGRQERGQAEPLGLKPSTRTPGNVIIGPMSVIREVPFPSREHADPALSIWLDDTDSHVDVIDALALSPFATGLQPWSREAGLERVRADAPLRPAEGRVVRTAVVEDGMEARLVCGEGWTLRVVRHRNRTATLSVSAISEELARTVLKESVDGAEEPAPLDDHVEMGFWWCGSHGGNRSEKPITAQPWDQIRGNYTERVRGGLDDLMKTAPGDVNGRLLLLHGPPGTGKTTLLRTLARQWHDWCQVDCVLDPEARKSVGQGKRR